MPLTPAASVEIRRIIVSNEGWYTTTYNDSLEIPTIGVGLNLQRADAQQRIEGLGLNFAQVLAGTQALTNSQVDLLFQEDFNASVASVETMFPGFANLSLGRQAVLIDMRFNLGAAGLAGFHNMIAAVNAGDWATAQEEMQDSAWATQVGQRATRNVAAMGSGAVPAQGGGGPKPIDKAKEGKEGGDKGKDTGEKAKDGKDQSDKGKDGKDGKDQADKGKEGKDGKDESDKGKEGKDGKDQADKGKEGKDESDKGKEGKDGKDQADKGKEGKDGKDESDKGKEGKDGKDQSDKGKDGKDGKDQSDKGKDGKDQSDKDKDGKDGKDGLD